MRFAFQARPILLEKLRQAHSVLQLGLPDVSLDACRPLCAWGQGRKPKPGALIGVFDRRDYIHAVFRVRIEAVLPHGQSMKVFDLVAADLTVCGQSAQLLAALETLAREEGCESLTVTTPLRHPSAPGPLSDMLRARGYEVEGLLLARRI